jgi:hypothetical protein
MKYSTGEIVKNYDVAKARHQRCVVLDAANGHIAVLENADDNHVLIDQVSAGDGFTLLHRCVDMETSLQQLYKLPFSSYSILAQEDGTECFFKCLHMENEHEDRDRKLFEVNASLYFQPGTPRTIPANDLRKYTQVRQPTREEGMEMMREVPHRLKL